MPKKETPRIGPRTVRRSDARIGRNPPIQAPILSSFLGRGPELPPTPELFQPRGPSRGNENYINPSYDLYQANPLGLYPQSTMARNMTIMQNPMLYSNWSQDPYEDEYLAEHQQMLRARPSSNLEQWLEMMYGRAAGPRR